MCGGVPCAQNYLFFPGFAGATATFCPFLPPFLTDVSFGTFLNRFLPKSHSGHSGHP